MALLVHRKSTLDVLLFQGDARGLDVVGIGHKVHQPGFDGNGGLQRCIVQVKPAFGRGIGRAFGAGLDGDDFQIGQRVAWRGDFEQAVVGAVRRVLAACGGRDAQRGFAPLHALFEGMGCDDQVINLCFHHLTLTFPQATRAPMARDDADWTSERSGRGYFRLNLSVFPLRSLTEVIALKARAWMRSGSRTKLFCWTSVSPLSKAQMKNCSTCRACSGLSVTWGRTTKVPMVMGQAPLPGMLVSVLVNVPCLPHSLLSNAVRKAAMDGWMSSPSELVICTARNLLTLT